MSEMGRPLSGDVERILKLEVGKSTVVKLKSCLVTPRRRFPDRAWTTEKVDSRIVVRRVK